MKMLKAIVCAVVSMGGFGAMANNCATMTGSGATLHTSWYGQGLSNSFSIGMWIKGMTAQYHVYPFNSSSIRLYVANGEQALKFSVDETVADGTSTETVSVADWRSTLGGDDWHFYCCTFNYDSADSAKSFQRLYIDGELRAEKSGTDVKGSATAPVSTKHVCIGGEWDAGGWANWRATSGSVSEVTVWNKALSAEEVERLKTSRAGGSEAGLVIYWSFAGTTANAKNGAKSGVTATLSQSNDGGSFTVTEDPAFPLLNCRCVASPQWVEEHGYVEPQGASYRNWTEPATSIAKALDVAQEGETIYVMKGTYSVSETITVSKANTRMCSYDPTTTDIDPEGTILDGGNKCRVLKVDGGSGSGDTDKNIEVDGFTIKNGKLDGIGGGAFLRGPASSLAKLALRCRIANCVFTNCTAANGGALRAISGYVTNCTFVGCSATTRGGGVFFDNVNYSSLQHYGAYAKRYELPIAYGSHFIACSAGSQGGAAGHGESDRRPCLLEGCFFKDNVAKDRGGSVYAGYGAWIRDCVFEGEASAQYGACLAGPCVTVTNCVFRNLNCNGSYGMIHTESGDDKDYGSRYLDCVVTNVDMQSDLFYLENVASTCEVLVRNSLFARNGLGQKSVFRSDNSKKLRVENCTIAGNEMTAPAISYYERGESRDVCVNTIFDGVGIDAWQGNYRNIMSNCCVSARVTSDPGDSNVVVGSPRFVDAEQGDFTLKHNSPCRDKGLLLGWMSVSSLDLAGNPRVVKEGKSLAEDPTALPDMGCYECMLKASGLILVVR